MDEESKELVQLAAEAGVSAFFKTVAAPLVEVGGWSADLVRRHRFKSAVRTLVLADKWLSEAGIDAQAVSLKVLVPLLEYASLEDEADEADNPEDVEAMQRRWAALLANAAAGNEGAGVPPGFPRILSEIEAQDARLLEMIAADGPMSLGALFASSGIDMSDVAAVDRIQVRVDNLERLQLCTVYRPDPQLIEYAKSVEAVEQAESGFPFNAAPLSGMFKPRRHRPTISRTVGTTALGDAFIVACTAPTGAQGR